MRLAIWWNRAVGEQVGNETGNLVEPGRSVGWENRSGTRLAIWWNRAAQWGGRTGRERDWQSGGTGPLSGVGEQVGNETGNLVEPGRSVGWENRPGMRLAIWCNRAAKWGGRVAHNDKILISSIKLRKEWSLHGNEATLRFCKWVVLAVRQRLCTRYWYLLASTSIDLPCLLPCILV